MRKLGLFLLLATSAMPALAQRSDDDREARREAQAERSESGAERPQRAERAARNERPQRAERQQRAERAERPQRAEQTERSTGPQVQNERQGRDDGQRSERMRRYQQQMQQSQQQGQQAVGSSEQMQRYQQQMQERRQQRDERRAQGQPGRNERLEQWRQRQVDGIQQSGGLVQRDRRVRPVPVIQPEVGQIGPVRTDVVRRIGPDGRYEREGRRYDRDGRDGRRYDRDDRNRWSNSWRNDRRYDWRRYRDRNRSIFSLGFYFDPFGYSYRRFGIGSHLYSGYYQSNYWINDPWQYRLPPAYGSYRWVRYHDDAVMIDTYSGEVVDVIYGFFW